MNNQIIPTLRYLSLWIYPLSSFPFANLLYKYCANVPINKK